MTNNEILEYFKVWGAKELCGLDLDIENMSKGDLAMEIVKQQHKNSDLKYPPITRLGVVKSFIKSKHFSDRKKMQKKLLLALSSVKPVKQKVLIKKTRTENFNSLKTLVNATRYTIKKAKSTDLFEIVGLQGKPFVGYYLKINPNALRTVKLIN